MKRTIIIMLAALALVAAGFWLWPRTGSDSGDRIVITPPDYQEPESWAVRPTETPPAVWEEGWAMDVVLFTKEAALGAVVPDQAEPQRERGARTSEALAESLERIGPVYAPFFRAGAEASDLPRSLESYIERENRGRAFVIVTDGTLPATLSEVLTREPLTHDRFAGILWLGPADRLEFPDLFQPPLSPSEVCPRRFESGTSCAEAISIGRRQAEVAFGANGAESRILSGFDEWLASNATRLAEPFGMLEDIETVDIRSPGQTDDND